MEEKFGNLTNDLARWVSKYQISRNTSNDLLTILRQYGHPEMPKCTRTLLKTQIQVHTEIKCGGDYIYLGISNGISRVFASNHYLQMDSNTIERCTVEGSYELGRVVFVDSDIPLRDDVSFEQALHLGIHQIHRSKLIDNGIRCVTQFPLDYMHLVCLGVIKRLLLFWKEDPRQYRLSAAQLAVVSEN